MKIWKNFARVTALAITLFLFSKFVLAEIPQVFQYQGKATDKAGLPIFGNRDITFRLYDAVTAGSKEWEETNTAVLIENGLFSVLLGGVTPLDLTFEKPYWISVEIDTDGEMTPRHQLGSVPYAYRASEAEHADVARTVQIYMIPNYITGCELEYVDADSIRVTPGSFELGGHLYTRTTYPDPLPASASGSWLDGGSEPTDGWIYVYLETSENSWEPIYALDPPNAADAQGNTEGHLRYLSYSGDSYRCVGAVRNDSSSNMVKFFQRGDCIVYDDETVAVLFDGRSASWTDVDCSDLVPAPMASTIGLRWSTWNALALYIRRNGSSAGKGIVVSAIASEDGLVDYVPVDTSGLFEYRVDTAGNGVILKVMHYTIDER